MRGRLRLPIDSTTVRIRIDTDTIAKYVNSREAPNHVSSGGYGGVGWPCSTRRVLRYVGGHTIREGLGLLQ